VTNDRDDDTLVNFKVHLRVDPAKYTLSELSHGSLTCKYIGSDTGPFDTLPGDIGFSLMNNFA